MHYRHACHAGNFADVWKHCILLAVLSAMRRKTAPLSYLESHAGAGCYRLDDADAMRTGEWRAGIGRLLPAEAGPVPAPVADYLRQVAACGSGNYPGSPWLAARGARPGDEMQLCESQPEVAAALRRLLPRSAGSVQQRDGYELDALLPPRHSRVALLIDPPFERRDEFEAVAALVARCLQRCRQAVILVWYPRKNRHAADRMLRRMARSAGTPLWHAVIDCGAVQAGSMHACGLAVLNLPYGLEQPLGEALAWLAPRLAAGRGSGHRCEWVAASQ